jgi:predicted GNAT family acetyltransferase
MNPTLLKRVQATWLKHFDLPESIIQQPGTTIVERGKHSWILLWTIGEHAVVEANSTRVDVVKPLLAKYPGDHVLTMHDITTYLGDKIKIAQNDKLYMLDRAKFHPAKPANDFTVRQLTSADQSAFDAFLGNCPKEDREESDIGIDHEMTFATFDGDRIISAASAYDWRGFVDIGVLSDPTYRKKGLSKAAATPLCKHFIDKERVVIYRHDYDNYGSQGVAQGLGFTPYPDMGAIKPEDNDKG